MTENNLNPLEQPEISKIETNLNPENKPIVNQTPNKNIFKIVLITLGIVIFVSAVGASAYYLGSKKQPSKETSQNTTHLTVTPSDIKVETPLFSGHLQKLDQNLNIFRKDDAFPIDSITYYSAGVFNKGELEGYTRIVASMPSEGPSEPYIFILATKDFSSFILDDLNNDKYSENLYRILDKSKIVSTKTFDTNQKKVINLDKSFALFSQSFPSQFISTDKKDKYGNSTQKAVLVEDFSSYQKLNSPTNNLTFYFKPNQRSQYFNQMNQSQKDIEFLKEKYVTGNTEIIVTDSTGLPLNYSLSFIGTNQKNISFKGSAIENPNNLEFYNTYSEAIPGGCSMALNTKVTNLTDNDFEVIGSVSNVPLYRLKDKNHQFYSLAFQNKMEYYDQDQNAWNEMNKGMVKPNLEQYISQNPLLFLKDYWQRWISVGEYDINLPGGCGKPVVYLYPEKTIEVSVKFNVPVKFTTDIPKYNDSWQVLAQPNGSLKNLKSNQESCQQIDFTKRGSEYAKQSCETNNYPYLYWAGNVYSKNYPFIDRGWVVAKNNLNSFLENKLSEIGLNSNEKKDFMEYWLPDMESKNSPYYRISFLQTNELNSLFPMTVDPRPDTVFRIFLDYLPLDKKPNFSILPQTLNKLIRRGFTLVEWGGLKRY